MQTSIFGYYFNLFAMKRKLYKENRYFSLVLLNKHHIFFSPPKIVLKAILFKGKKSLVVQLLEWMVSFPRLKTLKTDLLWIKDIFCITANCDEVKWTLFNMPWNRKLASYKNTTCHLLYLWDLSAIHISSKCDLPFTPDLCNCLENQWQVYNNQHEALHTVQKKTFW